MSILYGGGVYCPIQFAGVGDYRMWARLVRDLMTLSLEEEET